MPIPSPAEFRDKTKKHSEVREMMAQMAESAESKDAVQNKIDAAIVELITKSSNLFNDSTSIKQNKYIGDDGAILSASQDIDWAYTEFIVVQPHQNYYFDGFRHVALYDANKNFISRVGVTANNQKYSASINVGAAYFVRANYRTALNEQISLKRMINTGTELAQYEDYQVRLKPDIDFDVSAEQVDFIKKSNNLFVLDTVTKNKVISSSGLINDAIDYSISDFIEVTPNTKYTISGDAGYDIFTGAAFYDADKNFVARYTTSSTGFRVLTTGSNTAYVRFNINHSSGLPEQRNRMFNAGETALPYERGGFFLDSVSISDDDKEAIVVNTLNYVDLEYGDIKDKFVKSNNLFDASAATLNKVITSSGVIDDASDYHISDFIAVVAGQKYTLSGESGINAFITTAYYGANKNFIQRVNTYTTSGPLTITIPAGVSYLRFNMNNGLPTQRNRMFNIGETALPYETFVSKLANVRLDKGIIDQIGDELIVANTNTFMYDLPIDQPYYTDAVWTEHSNFRTITSDQVYAMYDDLASQHPSFITKHSLANNSLGQSIAYYKFKPLIPSVDISNSRKLAKVFLLCGQHGMEHTPPLATFLMLREIYNNWQSSALLEALRFNVEFVVLPVANPDGWNKFTRANPNGVDLNRNYSEGWVYRTDVGFYSGESPFSEIETQNVRQVFDENADIDIFYDFHNFNGTSAATHPHIIWVSALSNDKQMARMAQCLTSRMTRHWRKEYTFIPQEPYFAGIFDSGPHAGMAASYAKSRGAKLATTFELGNQWWIDPTAVPHDTIHKRTTMEALTNWVLLSLNELKRI